MIKRSLIPLLGLAGTLSLMAVPDTFVSYQGVLKNNNQPATGVYDFVFELYSASTGGAALAASTNSAVGVTNGLFNALMDFGTLFDSQPRWLNISVRSNSVGIFTPLGGRQRISATPKSVHAVTADTAQLALGAEVSTINSSALQDGAVINVDIATNAAIADTKLATISTTGKVANSATTATSSNVPNTIVARNNLGDFEAGLIIGEGLDVTGFIRSGSETGTSEPPVLPGLVIRRFDSTVTNSGSIVASTDNCRLVRDGTNAGLRFDYDGLNERLTFNAIGLTVFGTNVNFRATLIPAAGGSLQLFSNAQRVVHAQISFGNVFGEGNANVTHVVMDRYDSGGGAGSDFLMTGTITSSYNQ